jgi:hypothetical protein
MEKEKTMEKSMTKYNNVRNTDGSEKNGGFKNTTPPPRPPVTPPPQKPAKK